MSKLNGIQEPIINGVIVHIALFCWSFFNAKGSLDLHFVKTRMNRDSWLDYLSDEGNKESDEETQFRVLVSVLRLDGAEYDPFIIELLEHGFTNLKEFGEKIEDLSKHIAEQAIEAKLEKAWDIYAKSFEDNLDSFIAAIKSVLNEHLKELKLKGFSDAINILSEFNEDVDEYISSYIEAKKDSLAQIDIRDIHWGGRLHSRLASEIEALHEGAKAYSIDEIALKIAQGSWSSEDIDYLHSLTTDDYFDWMMSSPVDLVGKVRGGFLSFGRTSFSQDAEKYHKILTDVEGALRKIASLNELNKKRISNIYRISLDETAESTE